MTLHYASKKLDSTVVSEYFEGIQLPADYLKLFQEGNLFSVGKWRFYPVEDKDNFKKTALHFKAMNARSEQQDYWEIATDRDAYSLGFKKGEQESPIYVWHDTDLEPEYFCKDIQQLIDLIQSSAPSVEKYEQQMHTIKMKLKAVDDIHYIKEGRSTISPIDLFFIIILEKNLLSTNLYTLLERQQIKVGKNTSNGGGKNFKTKAHPKLEGGIWCDTCQR
ncbi:MAG: hypothetical protein Q4F01_03725 [Staphylococcus rostri]|uniref:hypothetical protein n=1 Tax=Staphylococcus rostri TaxID=522262 RepID=UPI0026DF8A53|nr:hypothetical protein [Staphylococcus rostri]MDO5375274.1 hypothetical protein [Staphylococcus rostri]